MPQPDPPLLHTLKGPPVSIILALAIRGPQSQRDLSRLTGWHRRTLRPALQQLEALGLVARHDYRTWTLCHDFSLHALAQPHNPSNRPSHSQTQPDPHATHPRATVLPNGQSAPTTHAYYEEEPATPSYPQRQSPSPSDHERHANSHAAHWQPHSPSPHQREPYVHATVERQADSHAAHWQSNTHPAPERESYAHAPHWQSNSHSPQQREPYAHSAIERESYSHAPTWQSNTHSASEREPFTHSTFERQPNSHSEQWQPDTLSPPEREPDSHSTPYHEVNHEHDVDETNINHDHDHETQNNARAQNGQSPDHFRRLMHRLLDLDPPFDNPGPWLQAAPLPLVDAWLQHLDQLPLYNLRLIRNQAAFLRAKVATGQPPPPPRPQNRNPSRRPPCPECNETYFTRDGLCLVCAGLIVR